MILEWIILAYRSCIREPRVISNWWVNCSVVFWVKYRVLWIISLNDLNMTIWHRSCFNIVNGSCILIVWILFYAFTVFEFWSFMRRFGVFLKKNFINSFFFQTKLFLNVFIDLPIFFPYYTVQSVTVQMVMITYLWTNTDYYWTTIDHLLVVWIKSGLLTNWQSQNIFSVD